MKQVQGSPAVEPQVDVALERLAERVDAHERHRPGHASRIAVLAVRLAERLDLPRAEIHDIRCAALAHGLGLYRLRLGALERSGPLTLAERVDLWRHPLIAEQELARRGGSRHAQLLVRWHHEWWNGLGYPDMLAAEAIPLGARIIRIAESYEAMCSDRPYREALDPLEARRIVAENRGIEFDPHLATRFLDMLEESLGAEPRDRRETPRLPPIIAPSGEGST